MEAPMSRPSPLVTTIVQAGAGTGKTESLATRILDVAEALFNGAPPRLVATTFTERATSELRERVILLLARRESPPLWLQDFVHNEEHLRIGTIHGTLSSILHKHGSHLGLDPEFTIADQEFERQLYIRAVKDVLKKSPEFDLILEQYSFDALVTLTRKLTSHFCTYKDRFQAALGWREVIAFGVAEIKKTFCDLEKADTAALSEKTGASVLELQTLGSKISNIEDDLLVKDLFLETIEQIKKPAIQEGKRGSELKPLLNTLYDYRDLWAKDTYLSEINRRFDEVSPLIQELVKKVFLEVQKHMTEAGMLSFDDLEFLTLELVTEFHDVAEIIRQEYDFWFVDEYQDTSPLQRNIIFKLLRKENNAYFVGDPQQSIYLFRGADENVFSETKDLIEKAHGRVEFLSKNFRSHPDLLIFLNHIFSRLKKPVSSLEAKGPTEGTIRAEILIGSESCNEDILVTKQCFKYLRDGHALHEIAILVRTNDKARAIAQTLSRYQIPVYIHSTGGFYDRREVIDALGILSFLENPSDDALFLLIARSPWLEIRDEDILLWAKNRQKDTFWDYIVSNHIFENFGELNKIYSAMRELMNSSLSPVFERLIDDLGFFEYCLVGDASGRREANLRKFLWKLREEERKPNFLASEFIDAAWRDAESIGEESEAASFIEPQRVNILTIHKSKGLKFNCVIVPFCGEPARPKHQSIELAPDGRFAVSVLALDSEETVSPIALAQLREERQKRESDEEARVFYVAITRAAEMLCLTAIQKKNVKKGAFISEGSWLGQTSLDLAVGKHEGYDVHHFEQDPVIEPRLVNESETNEEIINRIQLPLSKNPISDSQFTVSQAIKLLTKGREKKVSAKQFASQLFFQLEAQQRGQAMHFIFEELKKDLKQNISALCKSASKKFNVKQAIDVQIISSALGLKSPPLEKIIALGFVEWPFEFREGSRIFEGQIDLWGKVDNSVWVIDYKSAKKLDETAIDTAIRQLELYALAISKTGVSWDQLKLAIVSPYEGSSHEIRLRSKDQIITEFAQLDFAPQEQNA
jgi:ATP-dependent helicase/nuclease subunit A